MICIVVDKTIPTRKKKKKILAVIVLNNNLKFLFSFIKKRIMPISKIKDDCISGLATGKFKEASRE